MNLFLSQLKNLFDPLMLCILMERNNKTLSLNSGIIESIEFNSL